MYESRGQPDGKRVQKKGRRSAAVRTLRTLRRGSPRILRVCRGVEGMPCGGRDLKGFGIAMGAGGGVEEAWQCSLGGQVEAGDRRKGRYNFSHRPGMAGGVAQSLPAATHRALSIELGRGEARRGRGLFAECTRLAARAPQRNVYFSTTLATAYRAQRLTDVAPPARDPGHAPTNAQCHKVDELKDTRIAPVASEL